MLEDHVFDCIQTDGGALKIYSTCVEGVVAEVDPFFDRNFHNISNKECPRTKLNELLEMVHIVT